MGVETFPISYNQFMFFFHYSFKEFLLSSSPNGLSWWGKSFKFSNKTKVSTYSPYVWAIIPLTLMCICCSISVDDKPSNQAGEWPSTPQNMLCPLTFILQINKLLIYIISMNSNVYFHVLNFLITPNGLCIPLHRRLEILLWSRVIRNFCLIIIFVYTAHVLFVVKKNETKFTHGLSKRWQHQHLWHNQRYPGI